MIWKHSPVPNGPKKSWIATEGIFVCRVWLNSGNGWCWDVCTQTKSVSLTKHPSFNYRGATFYIRKDAESACVDAVNAETLTHRELLKEIR